MQKMILRNYKYPGEERTVAFMGIAPGDSPLRAVVMMNPFSSFDTEDYGVGPGDIYRTVDMGFLYPTVDDFNKVFTE